MDDYHEKLNTHIDNKKVVVYNGGVYIYICPVFFAFYVDNYLAVSPF
jgi:hypothetical protein